MIEKMQHPSCLILTLEKYTICYRYNNSLFISINNLSVCLSLELWDISYLDLEESRAEGRSGVDDLEEADLRIIRRFT